MTLGVVKKNEQDFADWVSTEDGFLEALVRFDDDPLTLEAYQLAFLRNRNKFRWVNKSRQVGYSFVFACEAMARCHLRNQHNAIFVSYNLDDAKEKILIARQIHESLPLAFQKRLVVDSKTELAFESNGAQKNVSRILSQPSKAPRGKKGDIYLDEIAHYLNDRAIYTGSTALILRSGGQVTGASTPLGRRGIFWEIATQELRPYPRYTRQSVPWWLCSKFCLDTRRAAREADSMPTADRVAMFGTPDIIDQFDSLPIDDFQQEYECVLPGSLVATSTGPVPIESVRVGDQVLTHLGRYRTVTGTRETRFSGSMVEIKTYHVSETLKVTDNHPVLVRRIAPCAYGRQVRCLPTCGQDCSKRVDIATTEMKFVPAGELQASDVLVYPIRKPVIEAAPRELVLSDYWTQPAAYKSKNKLADRVPITDDLLRLIGYYIAKGSISKDLRHIDFCFSPDEVDFAQEVIDLVYKIFGLRANYAVTGSSAKVGVNSVVLGTVFAAAFGKLQYDRKLPDSWMNLSNDQLWQVVTTYMNGDGCARPEVLAASTVSASWAHQLREVYARVGYVPSLREVGPTESSINGRACLSGGHFDVRVHTALTSDTRGTRGWNDGDYLYLPIRSLNRVKHDGSVHNLQVHEDESFVVHSHAVHNCSFVDESYSYYPYELILPCTIDDMSVAEDISDLKRPEGRLVAGYDVGRTRDASELMVFEEMNGRFTQRLMMSFVQVPFSRQESELRRLLGAVPIARLSIDRNGIGMNLAENLSREFPQVVGETFTNASKERWATDVKILMQRRDLAIPRHRELVSQMHSIRRRVLQSGAVQFEGGDGKHHADKFWALALACQLERSAATASQSEVRVRVIG